MHRVFTYRNTSHFAADLYGRRVDLVKNNGFNFIFHIIRQLVAVGFENLDAVVFARIVRSGDHHRRVIAVRTHQMRHRRGRHYAERHHVRAHRTKSRRQRRFQHIF